MAWSCVGAQQGLGTASGLMKWTWEEEEESETYRKKEKGISVNPAENDALLDN